MIEALDGVGESAVIGPPHPDFGEGVAAVIAGGDRLKKDAVVEACKAELASFKVPKAVFFLKELPRNSMGKVQKNQLRERFALTFKSA